MTARDGRYFPVTLDYAELEAFRSTTLTKSFTQDQLIQTAARLLAPEEPGLRLHKDAARG
jgi:hypothetical protein